MVIKHDSGPDEVLKHMPKALLIKHIEDFRKMIGGDKPYRKSMKKDDLLKYWGEHIPTSVIMEYKRQHLEAKAQKVKAPPKVPVARKPRVVKPKAPKPAVDKDAAAKKIQAAFKGYIAKKKVAPKILKMSDKPVYINIWTLSNLKKNPIDQKIRFKKTKMEELIGYDDVDWNWLNQNSEFISKLTDDEIYTLRGYTVSTKVSRYYQGMKVTKTSELNGEFIQVRNIIRRESDMSKYIQLTPSIKEKIEIVRKSKSNVEVFNTLKSMVDDFKEEFWMVVVKEYAKDLEAIFNKAPRVEKKTIVYRGMKGADSMRGVQNRQLHTKGIISTSVSIDTAVSFSDKSGVIKRITLMPGTKALFVAGLSFFPEEYEIILPNNTKYYIHDKANVVYQSLIFGDEKTGNNSIEVTNMTVI